MIRCSDNSLYTGITRDVVRRLHEHAVQGSKCAKYLRGMQPFTLVLQLCVADRGAALKLEAQIKRLSKSAKENFIQQNSSM